MGRTPELFELIIAEKASEINGFWPVHCYKDNMISNLSVRAETGGIFPRFPEQLSLISLGFSIGKTGKNARKSGSSNRSRNSFKNRKNEGHWGERGEFWGELFACSHHCFQLDYCPLRGNTPSSAVGQITQRGVTMITENYCQEILKQYPEYITKDQMYRICHISKKTCVFLLESGLVPCIDSGKKTHRFQIRTADVIQYLRDRDDYPELFKAPDGFYKKDGCKKAPAFDDVFTAKDLARMRQYYRKLLANEPDVMTVEQVSKFTGYHKNSVARWCSKKELESFQIRQRFYIPKEYLLEFLVSKYFIGITVKSEQHLKFNAQIHALRLTEDE